MSNENVDKYVIYDWAVDIKGEEEIEEFLTDPKSFLTRIGALKRSPEFNGFVNSDGEKVEPSKMREHFARTGATRGYRVSHYGIPYKHPIYCSILV
ncbi:MAG: hypothetical protein HRU33_10920 [Rhodobacteraceae bacterium]|nr:hypothetical protein [Paracoccaceae bacterium]